MLLMTGLSFLLAAASFPGEPAAPAAPEFAIGYKITQRQVEALDGDNVFMDGETVYAWTQVHGVRNGFVEHVWLRDGVEVARHYLPVGVGRRWRTWSRHTLKAGAYEVQLIGADGQPLKTVNFIVEQGGC